MEKTGKVKNGKLLRVVLTVALILAACGLLAFIALTLYGRTTPRADGQVARTQMKELLGGCQAYAADHDGNYPPSLEVLYPNYIDNNLLFYAEGPKGNRIPLVYHPGLKMIADPAVPLVEYPFPVGATKISGNTRGAVMTVLIDKASAKWILLFVACVSFGRVLYVLYSGRWGMFERASDPDLYWINVSLTLALSIALFWFASFSEAVN